MFKDRVLEIVELAFDISTNASDDIFVSYSPHCHSLSVSVYVGGWERNKKYNLHWDIYYDITQFRSYDDISNSFNEVIEYLKSMEG